MLKNTFKNKKFLATLFLALAISACSSTDDEKDAAYVAELPEITENFQAEIVWQSSVDGVGDYFSRLKPIVAYDKVFTASRTGEAYAFDLDSGDQLWKTDLSTVNKDLGFFDSSESALIAGGPTAGIKKVFLGSENGDVFALDAETGELNWQGTIKGEVISAPAIDSGLLVVNSASGVMKAFNATNGEVEWEIDQEVPPLTLRGVSSPVIAAGGVVVGSADGTLNVYILANGQQGWSVDIGEASGSTELQRVIDVDSAPLAYGDKVYSISAQGNLTAIELRSGRVLWERQYSSFHQLAIDGNTIFLTDIKGHVYAIDRLNGFERWSQLSLTNRGVTGPVVVGDYVVVGDLEGYLHWIDQTTGDFVARHHVDGSGLHATPTVHKDIIYTQSRDGDLQAIKTP